MCKNKEIFILIGVILAVIFWICSRPRIYCKDYYAVVNRADNKSYESIINENGPIERIEFNEGFEYVYYGDGRTFVFELFPTGVKDLCRIDITSEQYHFGKKQIGVGTERSKIESIYQSGKNKYFAEDQEINVVEANTSIRFHFNDQNIVFKMSVGKPDIYE